MRTFFNVFPPIHFRKQWSDFEYLYNRFLPAGLVLGIVTLGISLAFILVHFSPLFATLAVLAIPMGIILVSRPQLGLLLVVFAISFEELTAFGPGVSILKLLSVVVFGGAVIHFLIFRRKESLVNVPQNWLLILFIMAALISNFTALDPIRTIDRTGRLLRVLTLYLIVINLIQSKRSLNYLLWVFLISGFISAAWGLLDPAQAGQRIYGTLGHPNNFALAMVPLLPLALCLFKVEKAVSKRLFLLIMVGVVAYALILSGSRGGMMSAVLALFLLVLTQKNKIFWFSITAFIIVIGLIIMPLHVKQRIGLVEAWDEDSLGNSTERRETYQVYGLQLWQENPILGVGLDGFAEAYTRSEYRFLQKDGNKRVAHNTYLEILVGTGLVGFILFMALLIFSMYKAWQYAGYTRLHPYAASVSAGLFAGQGGYFLGILFGSRQYEKNLWLLIALVVVIQVLMTAAERKNLRSSKAQSVSSPKLSSNGHHALP